jgi:hypothetical protein
MIYNLYFIDANNAKKIVKINDIHPYHVWQVSQLWGTAIAVVLEDDDQPEDYLDYEVIENGLA